MSRSVLVGVGDDRGWEALAWAVDEVADGGGTLTVCRVDDDDLTVCDVGAPGAALLELTDPVLARTLVTVRARLGGHRVRVHTRPGRPGPELVAAAADADLLVVGHEPGERVGATVRHIVRHAPCPLVVVRPVEGGGPAPFAGHVVVGVDGSPGAADALGLAFRFADRHRCPLAAVHVSAQRREDYWFDDRTLSTSFAVEPAGLVDLGAAVQDWELRYPRVPVKRAVLAGPVVEGLLRAGVRARLLVLGRGAHGPVRHALLGSVNVGVLDAARCAVAVTPAAVPA